MDAEQALAIINEYNTGYDDSTPVPETDEGKIQRATYIVREAKKLYDSGVRDNELQTLLFFASGVEIPEEEDEVAKTYPRRSSGGFSESDERETGEWKPGTEVYVRENLPIPAHIEGDAEAMPRDLSSLSDKAIRKLSGEFNAYLARTTYLLGVEMSDLMNCNHLLEMGKAKALRGIDKGKKLAKEIDAEILADPDVRKYADKVNSHEQMVTMLKALKEIYSGNVDRLSREWTMRQNEWEKSR